MRADPRPAPRVVSLLPGATDWLAAFGAAGLVVGRTHLCDAPGVAGARVLTALPAGLGDTAPAIDASVRRSVEDGLSPFALDLDALRALRPDLVVTQSTCGVCAPPLRDVAAALAGPTGPGPDVLDFAPATLKQVLDAALDLGRRSGVLGDAMRTVADGERRLRTLADRVGGRRGARARPTVACVEWVDPPMTAGHWTPDLVEHAGARPVLSASGARSRTARWSEVAEADPDVLVVAACGRGVEASLADLAACEPEWSALRAVATGRAFVLDGDRLFNRPGPSTVRSAEVLASVVWGEAAGIVAGRDEAAPFSHAYPPRAGAPA